MAYGDGHIEQMSRDKWRVFVDFGINPITGKRDRVTRVVNGSKRDAIKVRDQIKRDRENGLQANGGRVTFREIAEQWRDQRVAMDKYAAATLQSDKQYADLLCKYIGELPLEKVTPSIVETLLTTIKADKEAQGVSFGARSMNLVFITLRSILHKAVNFDLIARNPCDKVDKPKDSCNNRESLSLEDAQRLLSCLDKYETDTYEQLHAKEERREARKEKPRESVQGLFDLSNVLALRLAHATGMRAGEAYGLSWGFFDMDNARVKVTQQLNSSDEITGLKTKASYRTIVIDADTVEHFRRWKTEQAKYLLSIGVAQKNDTPVFCSNTGGYLSRQNAAKWVRRWADAHDFEGMSMHILRHTQATHLLARGIDVKTVQTRLGHSSAAMTLDRYGHAIPGNDEKAASVIAAAFKKPAIKAVKTA